MERYDPQAIEAKWQQVWADERSFHVPNPEPAELAGGDRPKTYVVEMLPYPSGDLHMGHTLNYTIGDVITHLRRRTGHAGAAPDGLRRLRPAGRERRHQGGRPSAHGHRAEHRRRSASRCTGWAGRSTGVARSRPHEPSYYRWTQWLFLRFFERGLAYRKEAPVKWCPNDQTVLANEQVIDGRCERCGAEVEAKILTQWFFRITDYADALLDEMALLEDWPERVLTMQRNWIGRSQGARVVFRVEGSGEELPVFTTRPDTLFGATFFVLAPENPLVAQLVAGSEHEAEVLDYVRHTAARSEVEREEKEKDGVFTGRYAVNPVNGEAIPIWVADYVLMGYGTGAIMAVPAHDERDYAFAERYGLEIRPVVVPEGGELPEGGSVLGAHGERGARQLRRVRRAAEPRGEGADRRLARRARSRRGDDRLPPARLAVLAPALLGLPDPDRPLPRVRRGAPCRTTSCRSSCPTSPRSPRRAARRSRRPRTGSTTTCPTCGGPALRETDTMDTFVDSSWYFIRYTDPANDEAAVRPRRSPTTGCPSTSTSAASSTPCSTCSTRASSRR